MKTPNTQMIEDALLGQFGDQVRFGAWLCRRIAGTLTWSQHAWHEQAKGYFGNACDVFPASMAVGDEVAAFIRSEFPETAKTVLWRVKNHFDHVHYDTWPTGYGTPPCKGGSLRVRHRDGSIGRTFEVETDMPLSQADLDAIQALPLSEDNLNRIIDGVWYRLITHPVTGVPRGAQALLADTVKYSHAASIKD